MSDTVSKLTVLVETVKARLAQEKHAGDWSSVASSEAELQHVSGELSAAQSAEAKRLADIEAKRKADASKKAWDDAQADADALRASWQDWVNEMTAIDERLTAMADERKGLEVKAAELYQRGDALRSEPIAVSFPIPARLVEVQQFRIETIRR